MKFKRLPFALAASLLTSEAHALDHFSRACRFDQIPVPLQGLASMFFTVLGAPQWVNNLPNNREKDRYWILESITTDYLHARYYLFAEQDVYQWHQGNYAGWLYKFKRSSQSNPDTARQDTTPYEKFNIFTNNRLFLYSARAGSNEIVERTEHIWGASPHINRWRVRGVHRYYDPVAKQTVQLGESFAEDCNLSAGWVTP